MSFSDPNFQLFPKTSSKPFYEVWYFAFQSLAPRNERD